MLLVLADSLTAGLDNRTVGWCPPLLARLKETFVGDMHVGRRSRIPGFVDEGFAIGDQ
jgi:hypothetical protein